MPPELWLAIIVGVPLAFVYNRWWEHKHRLRCGAYKSLTKNCDKPVHDPTVRCDEHKGLPKRRIP